MTALQGAVEAAAPVSRLHEHQSYELADFPVPSGREEEWRFIPLRRLRRLQGDTVLPECKVTVETDPAPEVAASRAERGASPARQRLRARRPGQCPRLRVLRGGDSDHRAR